MHEQSARHVEEHDAAGSGILRTVHVPRAQTGLADFILRAFAECDPAHLFVFASDRQMLERICPAALAAFPDTNLTGCTTAGQLGLAGYEDDEAVLIALPREHFATCTLVIDDPRTQDAQALIDRLVQERTRLAQDNPDKPNAFGFLQVDGLSRREDILAAAIAPGLGSVPLFGGSSGDGMRFQETFLAHGAEIGQAAALLTFVRTDCEANVFSLNHLQPTERKMVVTSADPERRIVKEINAEPAAREYARIVNKDPEQLDEFTFAAHPVVVQLGDTHHVRAIQRVNEKGELVFFAAIDEGMVLTIATAQGIAEHLDRELSAMTAQREDPEIFACDCILRRIEASQMQDLRAVSDVLTKNRVVGFSTYGEQIGPLHVNHTMTGVMLARPKR